MPGRGSAPRSVSGLRPPLRLAARFPEPGLAEVAEGRLQRAQAQAGAAHLPDLTAGLRGEGGWLRSTQLKLASGFFKSFLHHENWPPTPRGAWKKRLQLASCFWVARLKRGAAMEA